MMQKFIDLLSRKFIVAQEGIAFAIFAPVLFKTYEVPDTWVIAAFSLAGVAVGAYCYANVKDNPKASFPGWRGGPE